MPALIGSYSPQDVSITVNGTPLQGFAEGSMINFDFDTDAAIMTEGADGNASVAVKKGNRKGTLKVALMQTSLSNDVLTALNLAQKVGTAAFFAVQIVNLQGGESLLIPRAVIGKEPTLSYTDQVESREWTIVGQANYQPAGFEV